MERFIKRCKKNIGLIIAAFGLGLVIAVIAPFWSWVLFVGLCILALGVTFFQKK